MGEVGCNAFDDVGVGDDMARLAFGDPVYASDCVETEKLGAGELEVGIASGLGAVRKGTKVALPSLLS